MSNIEIIKNASTTKDLRPRVQELFRKGQYEEIYAFAQLFYKTATANQLDGKNKIFAFLVPLVLDQIVYPLLPPDKRRNEWKQIFSKEFGKPFDNYIVEAASSKQSGLREAIVAIKRIFRSGGTAIGRLLLESE